MKIALSTFACNGIETHLGGDLPVGVRTALFHYTQKLKAGRRPTPFPRFLATRTPRAAEVVLELTVDAETRALLEREALRQRTTVSQLVTHAVFVYLAELEFQGSAPRQARGPAWL